MITLTAREDEAMAEAGAWLARLQREDVGAEDGIEFEAWLAAAPANRAAYERVLGLWQQFEVAADEVLAELAAGERRVELRRAGGRADPSRRWLMGGGFAVAAALTLAVVTPMMQDPPVQTYVTGKGEHQRVALADGSTIDLNAETKLSVTLARSERRVALEDGEAIFDVASDARRPFTVAAAGREVRVLGTQFDVKSRDGELTVTVAHGRVQVRPLSAATQGRAFTLTRGQRLAVDETGAEALAAVDPQETFSWRAGRLVYRETPLSEVVADLNRQFPRQIEIGDPELEQIPITGVIVLDDPDSVAQRLSLMLPVRSVPSEKGLRLLRK